MSAVSWTVQDWVAATSVRRHFWRQEAAEVVSEDFRLLEATTDAPSPLGLVLPEFKHEPTSTAWVLVPKCSYVMGLSENEERSARMIEDPPPLNIDEMRPVHRVDVGPFLIMKFPLTWGLATTLLKITDLDSRPAFDGPTADRTAYLRRAEVEAVAEGLGFRLPTEAQWECACRGGTDTLFFFGNRLPSDLGTLESFVGSDLAHTRSNPFGLHGLFVGEWCRDKFRSSYGESTTTPDFVVRGGGSVFWPWQGTEWVFCMSAMRLPSSDLIDGLSGARLVFELV